MKDIIAEYCNWHDALPKDKRDRFDFIVNLALELCQKPIGDLYFKYSFREALHKDCFKNYDSFWRDELYNATKSLTDLKIDNMDFSRIATDLKNQITRMKVAVAKDREEFADNEGEFLDNELRFQSQFYCVLWYCDLMDEYLTTDIDTISNPKLFDTGKLKQFVIIIDLMAHFDHIVYLFFFKETGFHKSIFKQQKATTFEGLFRDKENAQKVKAILETKGYTENGIWLGLSENKSELVCVYYALKRLLFTLKVTPTVKIFYREFGFPDDYICEELMRKPPKSDRIVEFDKIFSHLIPKQKN